MPSSHRWDELVWRCEDLTAERDFYWWMAWGMLWVALTSIITDIGYGETHH